MTVTTSTNKKTYTGDASTTAFAYNFKILATTDLAVYTRLIASPYTETLQTETTHYSVSGAGDAGGGTVTMVSAPASTLQLIILRVVPQTQLTDYTANDAFPAETHEEALDRLAMIVQDQQETLDRTLKVSKTVTDLTTPEFKEPAAARAGKFLSFDGDGDELTVTDGPLADAVITSPADADVLIYDLTDTRWENKAVSGDIAITAAGVASIASGVIVNADVSGSAAIADTKLATISTADKVSAAAIQVDGATDGTGITIADADKLLVDDGGTTKYVNMSQVNAYTSASVAADDLAVGDAASSFATSSGAVLVDSQASTTTVDGHTGVTVQSSSSGDILLDSAADVVLDAAGNDVVFKASGTAIGTLTNSSSDLVITANVQDKDILLKGDDGGGAITALQLDMSDAGKATFSGGVALGDDQKLSFGAAPDLTIEYDEDGTDTTRIVAANGLSLAPHGTSSGNTTELRFMELAAGGNNYVGFKAADAVTDSVYTLPAAFPASNKLLQSTDAGVLTWETAGGSTTLSGSTNNTVATVTGANALQGEANLTFDGNVLAVPDGAVATPSLTNTGDLNTGVYFPAADTVGVAAGGSSIFQWGVPGTAANAGNPVNTRPRNLFYNGDFQLTNHDADASVAAIGTGGYHVFDGVKSTFFSGSETGRYNLNTSPLSPANYNHRQSLRVDVSTADSSLAADHWYYFTIPIEARNCQAMHSSAPVPAYTTSFWVYTNKTGDYQFMLKQADGGRSYSAGYTVSSADTWTRVVISTPADSGGNIANDSGVGLELIFMLSAGADARGGTEDAWASTANNMYAAGMTLNLFDSTSNYWLLAGVQIERGLSATNFEFEEYNAALTRSRRYYERLNLNNTGSQTFAIAFNQATTVALCTLDYVPKRAFPTLTFTAAATFEVLYKDSGGSLVASDCTAIAAGQIGENTTSISATISSGLVMGEASSIRRDGTDTAYVEFSAEF